MVNRPSLKMDILKLMMTGEPYSQSMVMQLLERIDSGNISRVWNGLIDDGLINNIESARQLEGLPRRTGLEYYTITILGAQYLVLNSGTARAFWDSLARYVYYNHKSVTYENIFELYTSYVSKYFKYTFEDKYPFQLDFFNRVCTGWIENVVIPQKKLSTEQKVIEALARSPYMTMPDICDAISEKSDSVQRIIGLCTLPSLSFWRSTLEQQGDVIYMHDLHEWKYQKHKIIQINQNSNEPVSYSLTLFGVLLALFTIRSKLPNGLFYKNYRHAEYFDLIVKNYATKLPLIFGKWDYLKSVLGNGVYSNFGVITSKAMRDIVFSVSVVNGGNKEFYDGVRFIAEYSRNDVERFNDDSLNAIYLFKDNIPGTDHTKGYKNYLKLRKIYDLVSHVQTLVSPSGHFEHYQHYFNPASDVSAADGTFFYDVPYLEKCLSREATSTYLLSLDREFEPHEYRTDSKRYDLSRMSMREQRKNSYYPTLRDRLKKIHDGNSEIGNFLDALKLEVRKYHSEVGRVLSSEYKSIV